MIKHQDVDHLPLSDRKSNYKRNTHPQCIDVPNGYRCCISFEEQPAGLCRHLSVSVEEGLPNPIAFEELATLFGFSLTAPSRRWLEEYEPGHHAMNIVELV